jgi:LysM repeat protein
MRYNVKFGDSPTRLAREYGVPFDALIRANPFKPTTVVAGRRTWVGLAPNEEIIIPVGGMVGDAASDVIAALVAAGGPCQQRNVALVCAVQRAAGLTVDGKYGNDTSAAVRRVMPSAPGACSPTPSWWVKGQSACPGGAAPTVVAPTYVAPAPIPVSIAPAASSGSGSTYTVRQGDTGEKIAAAYTGDKNRWRELLTVNPNLKDPKYGIALYPNKTINIPASWGGGGGAAPTVAPTYVPTSTPVVAPPVSSVPAAAQILVSINPCLQSNVEIVRAVQTALGLNPDGKYGNDTSSAVRRLVPNAPPACAVQPWWGAKGVPAPPGPPAPPQAIPVIVAATTAAQTAQTTAAAATTPAQIDQAAATAKTALDAAAAAVSQATTPAQASAAATAVKVAEQAAATVEAKGGTVPGGGLVAPEKKEGLSTGAIVAGAVGIAALVGLVAVAVSGKRSTYRTSTTTIRRAPRRAAPKRKSAPRKKSSRKKKR